MASNVQVVATADTSQVTFTLHLACTPNGYLTTQLSGVMEFYQNGIMRLEIDAPGQKRFRISQEDLPVEWDQLQPISTMDFNKAFSQT